MFSELLKSTTIMATRIKMKFSPAFLFLGFSATAQVVVVFPASFKQPVRVSRTKLANRQRVVRGQVDNVSALRLPQRCQPSPLSRQVLVSARTTPDSSALLLLIVFVVVPPPATLPSPPIPFSVAVLPCAHVPAAEHDRTLQVCDPTAKRKDCPQSSGMCLARW